MWAQAVGAWRGLGAGGGGGGGGGGRFVSSVCLYAILSNAHVAICYYKTEPNLALPVSLLRCVHRNL